MVYNILTCGGFGETVVSTSFAGIGAGSCIKARLGIVILFFVIAIIKKWGGEEIGLDFSWLSFLVGVFLYFIIITFSGNMKFAFIFGTIGALVGGYVGGMFLG